MKPNRNPNTVYTSREVAQRAGVTYRQIDYWVTKGYIAHANGAAGTGNRREFDAIEVRVAVAIGELVRLGLAPEAASPIAREVAETGIARRGYFLIAETTRQAVSA